MSVKVNPNPATAGSVTGGLVYKGEYNVTTNNPDLTTSEKGDFYIVNPDAGTLAGVAVNVGDHIVFNQDAASPLTSAMFDVIDNTDAVSSVNGATGVVVLGASDVSALAIANNLSDLNNAGTARTNLGLGSAATEDVGTSANNVVQLDGSSRLPAVDGSQLTNLPASSDTLDDVVGRGATTATAIQTGGLTVTGDIDPNADATYSIGDENNRFISYHGDMNGAIRFKAKNDSGGTLNKGEVVYIKGISGTVPTVDKARANASATMPAFGLVFANANDQAEVQVITFGNLNDFNTSTFTAGDNVFVSAATAGALVNTAPTGESNFIQNIGRVVRSDASAGIVKVGGAGRSNATPNLDNNKIFLGNGSNQAVSTALSSIALSGFNNDAFLEIANNLSDLNNAGTARTNLGVAIGTDVQAYDAQLADIAGLATTDGGFIVGNGTNFVLETLATARTSLGLGSAATEDVGTAANNVVQLDGTAKLPAVDGSQLTNITATDATKLAIANNLSDLNNAGTARTNLGVAIGSDVQAHSAKLDDIAGLAVTDGNIIVGNGTNFVAESGATARTSLGLSIGTDVQAYDAQLADIAGLTPTDGNIIVGDGSNFVTESGATARTSLGLSIGTDVQAYDAQLADIAGLTPTDSNFIVGNGTNFVTESGTTARSSLGLGSAATEDVGTSANNVVQLDGSARLPAVDGSQLTNLPSGGGSRPTVTSITAASYTIGTTDSAIGASELERIYTCSSSAATVNLPASSGLTGFKLQIKNLLSSTITVDGNSTETIDGSTTFAITTQNQSITLVSDGSNWLII